MQRRRPDLCCRHAQKDRVQTITTRVCVPPTSSPSRNLHLVAHTPLPNSYAEVVDHAHLSASAGILKLFDMVQKGERWDYGDPGCNDRGQPIIHNILEMLGCIRPNHDIDLPVHSAFPQDEKDLADLAAQLKARQRSETAAPSPATTAERPISSVEDPTGFEVAKFEKMVFGQRADSTGNLSPTSLSRDSFDTFSSTGNPSPTSLSCDSSNSFSLASTTPPVPMGMRNNIPLSGRGPPSGNFTNSPLFPPPAFTQGLAVGDLTFNTSWGLMDPPGSMVSPYTNYSLFEDVLTDDLMVGDNYA